MRITRAQANKLAKKAKPAKPQVVAPIPQEKPKAPSAFKFKVDRDEHGRMTSVSAHLADDEEGRAGAAGVEGVEQAGEGLVDAAQVAGAEVALHVDGEGDVHGRAAQGSLEGRSATRRSCAAMSRSHGSDAFAFSVTRISWTARRPRVASCTGWRP